jgi:hypothetical protein
MQSLLTESLRTFSQAARRLPHLNGDRPVSPSTLFRWSRDGLRAADGQRIKLECRRIGRTFVTSDEAVSRFLDALNGKPEIASPRSPAEVRAAHHRAAEALNKAGIGC